MTNGKIKMVCFDWGGVILKHCRSWAEGCAAAGLEVRCASDGEPLDSKAVVQLRRGLTQRYQRGEIETNAFFTELASINRSAYTESELRCIHRSWLLSEYDGMHAVISKLITTPNVTTGLLSNTNEDHWLCHLPRNDGSAAVFPTASLLTHRFASHLLGTAKPDEQIYRMFEAATGYCGEEILFFDDLPENCAAAKWRGWNVVHVEHLGDTAAQVTDSLVAYGVW